MSLFRPAIILLLLVLAIPLRAAPTFTAPEPEDLIFYQVFIDRFENGDATNDDGNPRAGFSPSDPSGFHGGDLEGVRQRLPYIKGLGANAIWITPFVENVNNYHGYAAYNWYNVDPNFGTLAKLQQFVSEANDQGIAVYFDMVCNHQGDLVYSTNAGYSAYRTPPATYTLSWRSALHYPAPFDQLTYFHSQGNIGNFNAPEQELGELSGLDDLKTETQYVRDQMVAIWTYWLTQTGVSGFRIDTVKHAELGFWEDFLPRLRTEAQNLGRTNFFTFGEIYGADDNYMKSYVGTLTGGSYKLDAALDFQFYYNMNNVFATGSRPPSDIVGRLQSRATNLPGHHLKMPNFFDNHDVRRFMNVTGDTGNTQTQRNRRLEQALIFTFFAPGPPIVYYGTEQGFNGGNDPNNREDMFDGLFESGPSVGNNFATGSSLYRLTSRLAQLRSELAPLRHGDLVTRSINNSAAGHLAVTRTYNGQTLLLVMNTSLNTTTLPSVTVPALASLTLADALDPASVYTVPANGVFPSRTLAGQDAEIWVNQADVPPSSPEVIAFDPPDGSSGISITQPAVSVTFLTPMNQATTGAATTITPAVGYTPTWNGTSTVLTLTLTGGLAERTTYTVSVAATATSAEGAPLAVPAAASWTTGRIPPVLPPMPSTFATLLPSTLTFTVNGSPSEWPVVAATANTGTITTGNTFLWKDASADDTGDGGYTYPSNAAFTGGDADLDEFRVAYTASDVYFLFRPTSINASASFFTAYFGVTIDTGIGGDEGEIGFDQANSVGGQADALVRSDAAPDYELTFTGPRGAFLVANGALVSNPTSSYSQSTGVVEIRVPRSELGLAAPLTARRINLVVYTGLETFGTLREVTASTAQWSPGGGISATSDPDIFDLAGASLANQQADLSDYDTLYPSTIGYSILPLELSDTPPTSLGTDLWILE